MRINGALRKLPRTPETAERPLAGGHRARISRRLLLSEHTHTPGSVCAAQPICICVSDWKLRGQWRKRRKENCWRIDFLSEEGETERPARLWRELLACPLVEALARIVPQRGPLVYSRSAAVESLGGSTQHSHSQPQHLTAGAPRHS